MVFIARVTNYPGVEETYKTAANAYNWVKNTNTVGCIVKSAEDKATAIVKPMIDNFLIQKLDEMACYHVLDRAESVCLQLKTTSASVLILPVADRALNLAETCADWCLLKDNDPTHVSNDGASHFERVSRIGHRAKSSANILVEKLMEKAYLILNKLIVHENNSKGSISIPTVNCVINQVILLYKSALDIAKPTCYSVSMNFISTTINKLEKVNLLIKQSNTINWLDLKMLLDLLGQFKDYLEHVDNKPVEIELETMNTKSTILPNPIDEKQSNIVQRNLTRNEQF